MYSVCGWKDVWLGSSAAEGLTAGQKERECAERTISDQLRNKHHFSQIFFLWKQYLLMILLFYQFNSQTHLALDEQKPNKTEIIGPHRADQTVTKLWLLSPCKVKPATPLPTPGCVVPLSLPHSLFFPSPPLPPLSLHPHPPPPLARSLYFQLSLPALFPSLINITLGICGVVLLIFLFFLSFIICQSLCVVYLI